MKKILLLLALSFSATAGLPPTSSKKSGESAYQTTFQTDYGAMTGTRTGTKITPDQTGSGAMVLQVSPSLTTPNIGIATGTSLNTTGDITANDYKFNDVNFNTISGKETWATNSSTGVKIGGIVSIGIPNTTVSISDGMGICASNTGIDSIKKITWTGLTNQTLPFLTTNLVTYLAIKCSDGSLDQQVTPYTNTQSRDYIIIGAAVHTNLTTVNAVNQLQQVANSPLNQLGDLQRSLGFFNVSGNIYSPNGANLNLNKSAGVIHKEGSNWDIDTKNPNARDLTSGTAITFRYRLQGGTEFANTAVIDPNNYDDGVNLTPQPVAINKFTIQRIAVFSSNLTRIQYGQTVYNSMADAQAAIQTESFVTEANIAQNGLLRGFLIVRQGTTSLNSSSDAFFLEAPKFGGASGVGGLSTTTLQGAYNNSTTPQITTSTTLGALDVKRGSAADTDDVYRIMKGDGVVTARTTGEGNFFGKYQTPDNMLPNGDVELDDILMFTCGAGNTCTRTTTAGEFSQNKAALEVDLAASALNVSQTITTPSGIQKQGFFRIIYNFPATITDAVLKITVDGVLQTTVPTDKLIKNGLFNSIEIPLVFGSTNVKVSAETTATYTTGATDIFLDGWAVGQGLGLQNLQGDKEYSATVSSTGVVSGESTDWINGNCSVSDTSLFRCTYNTGLVSARMQCVASVNTGSFAIDATIADSTTNTYVDIRTGYSTDNVGNLGKDARAFTLHCQKTGNDYLAASANVYSQANADFKDFPYSPTISGNSNVSASGIVYSRSGSEMTITGSLGWNGAGTTAVPTFPLPLSLNSSLPTNTVIGVVRMFDLGVQEYEGVAYIASSTTIGFKRMYATASTGPIGSDSSLPWIPSSGDSIPFSLKLTIAEWNQSNIVVGSFQGVPVVPGATTERIDTFSVSYGTTNSTTFCSASPCSYLDQIGVGAVSSITRSSAGIYTINTSRTYTKLKCFGNSIGSNYTVTSPIECTSCSSRTFNTVITPTAALTDTYGTLHCQGSY